MKTTITGNQVSKRIIRRRELEAKTNLSRSCIYAKLRENPKRPADYDPTFPTPIPLGARAVGWIEEEVDLWLDQQAAKRGRQSGGGR